MPQGPPAEGLKTARFLMVLSSISPLFLLWAIRGNRLIPDRYLIPFCIAMMILPNLFLWWRIRTAMELHERQDIAVGSAEDPRAARHLASIRAQNEAKNIDKTALKKLCKRTGVGIQDANGRISIDKGSEMGFLEVLDRRRYHLELVKNSSEYFKAASRRKIGNMSGVPSLGPNDGKG